jgi:hypothetical protein
VEQRIFYPNRPISIQISSVHEDPLLTGTRALLVRREGPPTLPLISERGTLPLTARLVNTFMTLLDHQRKTDCADLTVGSTNEELMYGQLMYSGTSLSLFDELNVNTYCATTPTTCPYHGHRQQINRLRDWSRRIRSSYRKTERVRLLNGDLILSYYYSSIFLSTLKHSEVDSKCLALLLDCNSSVGGYSGPSDSSQVRTRSWSFDLLHDRLSPLGRVTVTVQF